MDIHKTRMLFVRLLTGVSIFNQILKDALHYWKSVSPPRITIDISFVFLYFLDYSLKQTLL